MNLELVGIGNQTSIAFRDRVSKHMKPAEIAEAKKLVQEWLEKQSK